MGKLSNFLRIAFFIFPIHAYGSLCQPENVSIKPDETGFIRLERGSGTMDRLYWAKLKAIKSPAKGTLFYLAGGPISHYVYLEMAREFQKSSYPEFDVVLYDYLGINCSDRIQDLRALTAKAPYLTQSAMARDFILLKRALAGTTKVFLMGGSHGSMLGAQIVSDYPHEIDRAILFSGSTETGWFRDGWFRFDDLLAKMASASTNFGKNLDLLLKTVEEGKLAVYIGGKKIRITRSDIEISLWMNFSQSAAAQLRLPQLVSSALNGNTAWIADALLATASVAEPTTSEGTPTLSTEVIAFHRCNIWYPKSQRSLPRDRTLKGRFLNYASFFNFWEQVCQKYDFLGEHPQNSTPSSRTNVPLLVWLGDQDYFEPEKTRNQFERLSSNLSFHIMPGWSHDFGPDGSGLLNISNMISCFLKGEPENSPMRSNFKGSASEVKCERFLRQ